MGLSAEVQPASAPPPSNLPPMLASYLEYKSRYPDCLLLCQVGDFYEVFFEDAVTVAKTLNLTLTSRDKNSPQPIPMCGVPIAVVDGYLNRLVAAGFSVAVVSQRPQVEGVKGMMPRYLERIVTPGVQVLGEGGAAQESKVGAIFSGKGVFALAFSDVTSGVIFVREELSRDELLADVSRAGLNEVILPALLDNLKLDRRIGWVRSLVGIVGDRGVKFRAISTVGTNDLGATALGSGALHGVSSVGAVGKRAVSLLREYVDETTAERSAPFERVQPYSWDQQLALDSATRRTLELVTNAADGSERFTLFAVMNRTLTPGGTRLLRRSLLAPSTRVEEISARQRMTGTFVQEEGLLRLVQDELRSVSDIERIATRIALRAATPRELAALRDSLSHGAAIGEKLRGASAFSGLVARCVLKRDSVPAALASEGVTAHLERWLVDSPAAMIGDGAEVIRGGQDEELDRYRALERNGHGVLAQLEAAVRAKTGISSLKVKFNNQLGYFFEVGKSHAEKLTSDEFQRRQSTTSGERFFTAELKSLEQELFSASGKARAREQVLFSELLERLVPLVSELRGIAQAVSEVDVFASLAQLARERGWVKPEVVPTRIDQRNELLIESGRHPILEEVLTDRFIPNTVAIDEHRQALIVTGPNMGGKSTYLRQIAQLVILAQIGSFVPAARMRMTVVDGVFARLGASDNLAEGDSTFMVEMRETALICAAATANSLVVIDEIGRGTATADGRALAQAILEWLVVQVKARVLFATHFHELTALASVYPTIHNVSVGAVERDGVVHFTHSIVDGPANRSYGIEVASHAGLPGALLSRARELLNAQPVGSDRDAQSPTAKQTQLSMFEPIGLGKLGMTGARSVSGDMAGSTKTAILHASVIKRVQELSISELTPLQALTILDELQQNLHE